MAGYRVNEAGVAKARAMIDARQYDLQTPWSDGAPSTEEENAFIDRHGYDGYGEWHLALDTGAAEGTKDLYGFPFGDFRRVSRAALIHAKQRASQNGHAEIVAAADGLLEHLDRAHAA